MRSARKALEQKGKMRNYTEKPRRLICFLRIISIVANAPMFFCTRFTLDLSAVGGCRAEAMTVNDARFHAGSETRLMGLQ